MTRETYRLVQNIHHLYIIKYILFYLHPCIQLPIILTQKSLILSCLCLLFHITLIYLIVSFLFHHFLHDTLLLLFHPYHPSDILQPLSIFIFLLHIKCIQITCASLFLPVHHHTYNHRTSMSSFHSLLRANILPLP